MTPALPTCLQPPAGRRRFMASAHRAGRRALTLFELILAIALSVALLALIGTAINLYLVRVDASRTSVEEAQLARSILARIADDLRAAAVYKAQDTSAVASLVAASAAFDPDSIDEENPGSGGGGGGGGQSGSGSSFGAPGSSTSSSGNSLGSSSVGGTSADELVMPLGVNGTLNELYVDVERLPRMEELFLTTTGYTNARPIQQPVGTPLAAPPRISNVKTVRYFIRQGQALEPGSAAATGLDPQRQLTASGLVRQVIDRPARVLAETAGNQAILETGQTLLAPEVLHIEFRYFNGSQVVDYWDMQEMGSLPPAIEVRIWLPASGSAPPAATPLDLSSALATAHQYRQIVYLPMSQVANSGGLGGTAGGTAGSSGTTGASGSTSGSSSGLSSGSGSSFGTTQ